MAVAAMAVAAMAPGGGGGGGSGGGGGGVGGGGCGPVQDMLVAKSVSYGFGSRKDCSPLDDKDGTLC